MKFLFTTLFFFLLQHSYACLDAGNVRLYPLGEANNGLLFMESTFSRGHGDGGDWIPLWQFTNHLVQFDSKGQEVSREYVSTYKDFRPKYIDQGIQYAYEFIRALAKEKYELRELQLVKKTTGLRVETDFILVDNDIEFTLKKKRLKISDFPYRLHRIDTKEEYATAERLKTEGEVYNSFSYLQTELATFQSSSFVLEIAHYSRGSHYDEEENRVTLAKRPIEEIVELGEVFHHGWGFDLFFIKTVSK